MAIILGAQFNNALLEYYPPRLSPRRIRKRRHAARREPAEAPGGTTTIT